MVLQAVSRVIIHSFHKILTRQNHVLPASLLSLIVIVARCVLKCHFEMDEMHFKSVSKFMDKFHDKVKVVLQVVEL